MIHIIICSYCKREKERKRRSNKKTNFCSTSCQMRYEYKNGIRDSKTSTKKANEHVRKHGQPHLRGRTGKLSNNWKGGRNITNNGYVRIRKFGGYVLEQRYVWETKNGPIKEGFQIHHINGNKQDNRIENLQCMSNSDHQKLHVTPRNDFGQFVKG